MLFAFSALELKCYEIQLWLRTRLENVSSFENICLAFSVRRCAIASYCSLANH